MHHILYGSRKRERERERGSCYPPDVGKGRGTLSDLVERVWTVSFLGFAQICCRWSRNVCEWQYQHGRSTGSPTAMTYISEFIQMLMSYQHNLNSTRHSYNTYKILRTHDFFYPRKASQNQIFYVYGTWTILINRVITKFPLLGMRTRCMYLYIVQRLLVCHSSDCIVMYYVYNGYTNLNILFTKNQTEGAP